MMMDEISMIQNTFMYLFILDELYLFILDELYLFILDEL